MSSFDNLPVPAGATPIVAGTFTPDVKIGASSQTLGTAIGQFHDLGPIVMIHIRVQWNKSADVGSLTIEGLPFTQVAVNRTSFTIGVISRMTLNVAGYMLVARVLEGTSVVSMFSNRSNLTATAMTDLQLSAGSVDLQLDGWMQVA